MSLLQVKQKTKNRIYAVFLLLGMILITLSAFQPHYEMGECGYYKWVLGNIKLFYVSCENNPHNTNLTGDVMAYGMMIFNPITVVIIGIIDIWRDSVKENG